MKCTPKQFADRTGKNLDAIYKAISSGRLSDSVTVSGRKKLIDLEKGKEELYGRVRGELLEVEPERANYPTAENVQIPDIDESSAAERFWKAKQAELTYRKQAGELVEAGSIHSAYHHEVSACRTKLLGVVSRVKQRATSASKEDLHLIEELIREALEELGRAEV